MCRHDQLQTDTQPSLANANDVQNLSELSACSSGANFIAEVSTNDENQLPKSNSDIEIVPYTVSNLHEEVIKSSNINAGVYFNEGVGRSRSSSSSSNDHQTTQDESLTQSTSQPQNKWNWRQQILENQVCKIVPFILFFSLIIDRVLMLIIKLLTLQYGLYLAFKVIS